MKALVATVFLCIVFTPFGVVCTAWAFAFSVRGEYLSAVVALGFGVFTLGLAALLMIVASRKVTPRVRQDDVGTTVRPDIRVDRLLAASLFGVFTGMAVYAIFTPLGMLDIPVPRGNRRYLLFVCAAAIVVGIFTLRQIIRRRGTSYLRMTVEGLEAGNTITTARRSWDEVIDIADRPKNGRQPTGSTYIMTTDGQTRTLPTGWYTPGGHALRELMRFYWQHREHRDELVNGPVLDRLLAGS